jgi:hypothetical protein
VIRWIWVLLVSAGLALAACSSSDKTDSGDATKKEAVLDPHQPPPKSSAAFKAGYTAGCVAGTEAAKNLSSTISSKPSSKKIDQERYNRDLDYKQGWDKAYLACYHAETSGSFFDGFSLF